MEFTEQQIAEMGLSEDQLPKVKGIVNANEADLKKEWDGKANKDAEAIIEGAFNSTITKFGIEGFERNQGEKIADALGRVAPLVIDSALIKEKSEVLRLQKEYDQKLKSGGDENLKQELADAKEKLDKLQQKEAQFTDWEANDYKGKYEEATKELSNYKVNVAFQEVKPQFSDTVNAYEIKGRWTEFKSDVLEKYNIEEDSKGEYVAIDKDNKHKIHKLKDLVAQNKEITELAKGREATGLGSKPKSLTKIEGVPFDVPEDATPSERQKLIKDYLVGNKKMDLLSPDYAKEYKKLNDLILKKN